MNILKKTTSYLNTLLPKLLNYKILLLVGWAILILKSLIFMGINPTFEYFVDSVGHLQKASITSLPWQGGWDTTYWGGYSTKLYPEFSHLILKYFLVVTGSEKVSMGIMYLILVSLYCHAVFTLITKKMNDYQPLSKTIIAFSFLFIYIATAGDLLVNLEGMFRTGSIASSLAAILFMYLLASEKWYTKALLIGLIIQTHVLTALITLIYLLVQITVQLSTFLIKNKDSESESVKSTFIAMLVGGVIGLPTIMTILDPSIPHAGINMAQGFLLGNVFLFIFIAIAYPMIVKTRLSTTYVFFIIVTLISSISAKSALWLQTETHIRGFHFYRFRWFWFISGILLFSYILNQLCNRKMSTSILKQIEKVSIIAIVSLSVVILIHQYPSYKSSTHFDFSKIQNLHGRVMGLNHVERNIMLQHLVEYKTVQNSPLIGSTGVFYESSNLGPQYYAFKRAYSPGSYLGGSYDLYEEFLMDVDSEKVKHFGEILGINYITYLLFDNDINNLPETVYPLGTISSVDRLTGEKRSANVMIEKISDTSLIESLDYVPLSNSDINLADWWMNSADTNLVVDQSTITPNNINIQIPKVSNITIEPRKIHFEVNSDQPTPLFIKFAYSPYWEVVQGAEYTTHPQWITPGYMFMFGRGDVTLEWITPQYLQTFGKVSFVTLIAMASLFIFNHKRLFIQPKH